MPALTIKNIPDDLYQALKSTAENHHRSINSEVIIRLKQALLPKQTTPDERLSRMQQLRAQIRADAITVAEINTVINEGRP